MSRVTFQALVYGWLWAVVVCAGCGSGEPEKPSGTVVGHRDGFEIGRSLDVGASALANAPTLDAGVEAARRKLNTKPWFEHDIWLAETGDLIAVAWTERTRVPRMEWTKELVVSVMDSKGEMVSPPQVVAGPIHNLEMIEFEWFEDTLRFFWVDDEEALRRACAKSEGDDCGSTSNRRCEGFGQVRGALFSSDGKLEQGPDAIIPGARVRMGYTERSWQGDELVLLWWDLREDSEFADADVFCSEGDMYCPDRGLRYGAFDTVKWRAGAQTVLTTGRSMVIPELGEPTLVRTENGHFVAWLDAAADKGRGELGCHGSMNRTACMPSNSCRGDVYLAYFDRNHRKRGPTRRLFTEGEAIEQWGLCDHRTGRYLWGRNYDLEKLRVLSIGEEGKVGKLSGPFDDHPAYGECVGMERVSKKKVEPPIELEVGGRTLRIVSALEPVPENARPKGPKRLCSVHCPAFFRTGDLFIGTE